MATLGPSIYIASKTRHAPRWKALRAEGWPIVSTWIDEAGPGESACLTDLWKRCVSEAANASVLILYREPDDVLKGAFIEAGVAMAMQRPIFAVACSEFSFVNHPSVRECASLDEALLLSGVRADRLATQEGGR